MTDSRSFWKINLVGWIAFALSMSLSRIGRFPFDYMLASKFVMAAIGLAISGFILRPLYQRALGDDPSPMKAVLFTGVASYVAAALWTALHSLIDIHLYRAFVDEKAHYTSVWQLFGGTLYDAFALLAWSVLYLAIRHQRARQFERERALRAEAQAQQARLDALRWQLNPHFLFNALNAISTLVIDNRGREATAMISRLGDLLRSTLELPAGAEIPVGDEMQLVRRYLEIEQVRLGDKLQVDIDVGEDAWKALVPPMLLQPLVENAVRHGIAVRAERGRVRIGAHRDGDRMTITVDDDGPGIADPSKAKNGIGLTNTRERLEHMYGDAHRFVIGRSEGGGTRIDIGFPYRER